MIGFVEAIATAGKSCIPFLTSTGFEAQMLEAVSIESVSFRYVKI